MKGKYASKIGTVKVSSRDSVSSTVCFKIYRTASFALALSWMSENPWVWSKTQTHLEEGSSNMVFVYSNILSATGHLESLSF